MYSFLVTHSNILTERVQASGSRLLEYTGTEARKKLGASRNDVIRQLETLPLLVINESDGESVGFVADVVRINPIVSKSHEDYEVELKLNWDIGAIPNEWLESHAQFLGIDSFEFHRMHWAVKEADLYKSVTRFVGEAKFKRPPMFANVGDKKVADIALMMPFNAATSFLKQSIEEVAEKLRLIVSTAEDIWRNERVMDDIATLIFHADVTIADLTGRNPNVFYEVGLAHGIGKPVVLLAQKLDDVPFDLRDKRVLIYENSTAGLEKLKVTLFDRLKVVIHGD